jgi:glucose-1-phosphate adenylyltransferase
MHLFDGYWEDIGTIRAFYDANLSLTSPDPPFALTSQEAAIYTHARFLPPTLMEGATIKSSLIADGCRIGKGAVVENSIIGLRCIIGEGVTIRDSILMGADYYESDAETAANLANGRPLVGIGDGAVIQGAILDKNCRVGRNARVLNGHDLKTTSERDDCMVCDGIPVVIKEATLPHGWKLSSS